MKKNILISILPVWAMLFMSTQPLHETNITIVSPQTEVAYKKGQIVDIHFKVRCGEKLKSVNYKITDQDDKVLFSKSPNVGDKYAVEEKTTWTINQTAPSVLTLFIEAKDIDGHSSSKVVPFNANF